MVDITGLLEATTFMYRKTDAVVVESRAGLTVTHVWMDTPELTLDNIPDETTHVLVDVHFFVVAVDLRAAEEHKDEFMDTLEAWPLDPTYMPENRLANGPSYIEMGAQIGTSMGQQDAMRFMALGEALGVWRVLTPKRLKPDLTDEKADRLAGSGYVLITPYIAV